MYRQVFLSVFSLLSSLMSDVRLINTGKPPKGLISEKRPTNMVKKTDVSNMAQNYDYFKYGIVNKIQTNKTLFLLM